MKNNQQQILTTEQWYSLYESVAKLQTTIDKSQKKNSDFEAENHFYTRATK